MSKQTINIGASPNDGTGTPLRTSFDYTNQNFTELYTALGGGVGLPGATTQVIFNDGGTNLAGDAGLVYNKTTDALTVAGLVTAGSATITGDLTVDTSTLKVDSTNNRVGVGTATPAEKLDIYSSAGTAAIKLQTAANIPFTLNSQIPGVSNDGFAIRDGTASANRLTIDSSGNVNVVGGNLVIGTSGKGIDFSATASGSGTMTSELLADYEEGTWTPVLATDNVTFTSVGYIFQVGKYTKVGNLVTVTGTIQTNSVVIGSAAGNVWITGLPFTQPSTDAPGGVNCFVAQSWAVDAPLAGYVYDSKIYLVERATSVSSSSLVSVADVATGGSNNLVRFSGHYYV